MLRGLIAVLSIALTVFALADCVQTEDEKVRGVPKWAWIVLIVLLPWVGPITWLFAGKERPLGSGDGQSRPRRTGPLAPDEDPDFLRKLDEDIRRERRAQNSGGTSADPGSTDGDEDTGPEGTAQGGNGLDSPGDDPDGPGTR